MSTIKKSSDRDEFKLLVTNIMDNWFGLQVAVSHGMGGTSAQTSAKLSHIIETITNMCFISETAKEDLSDALEDLVDELFNTEFEDGSVDEIAEILWNHKQNWVMGNKETIRHYIASMQKNGAKVVQRLDVCQDKMTILIVALITVGALIRQNGLDTDDEEPIFKNMSNLSSPSHQAAQEVDNADGWIIPRHNRRRKL